MPQYWCALCSSNGSTTILLRTIEHNSSISSFGTLCTLKGTKVLATKAYHMQKSPQAEHSNKTIVRWLQNSVAVHQKGYHIYAQPMKLPYIAQVHQSRNVAPFSLISLRYFLGLQCYTVELFANWWKSYCIPAHIESNTPRPSDYFATRCGWAMKVLAPTI